MVDILVLLKKLNKLFVIQLSMRKNQDYFGFLHLAHVYLMSLFWFEAC